MPLIPNSQRTHEQLVEMGRKGGRASGVTRRRRRMIKDIADRYAAISFIDLCALAQSLRIKNPAQMEWLIIELFGGLPKEHRENLLTEEALSAMGLRSDRAQEIIQEYHAQQSPDYEWPE